MTEFEYRHRMQILVILEEVEPLNPGTTLLELGVMVAVTSGTFTGFVGRIVANPFALDRPFTLCLEEAS